MGRERPPHHWERGLGRGRCPSQKFFSTLDIKMATLGALWALFSQFRFKCKNVVSRVKSTAKPAYEDYNANITGECVAYSYKINRNTAAY